MSIDGHNPWTASLVQSAQRGLCWVSSELEPRVNWDNSEVALDTLKKYTPSNISHLALQALLVY